MKSKILAASFFFLLPLAVHAGQAPEASHAEAAEDLFRTVNMEAAVNQSINAGVNAQIAATPELGQVESIYRKFFSKYMSWQTLHPRLIEVYTATFTEAELRELNSFYNSPTGQKAIALMSENFQKIITKVADQGQPSVEALRRQMAEVFAGKFTETELREFNAFGKSPTGQKAMTVMPELLQRVLAMGQKEVQDHIGELQEAILKKLKEDEAKKQKRSKGSS